MSVADRVLDTANILYFFPYLITEGNAKFQIEVSENKVV